MAEKQEIIYSFKFDTTEAIKEIDVAKAQIKALANEEKKLRKEYEKTAKDDAYYEKLEALQGAMERNKVIVQENTKVFKAQQKQIATSAGSIEQLRGKLKVLTTQYDNLSGEVRKSPIGEELRKEIDTLNSDIKSVEMSTGRFGRNVGNYLNSIKSAFADAGGAMGKMAGGVSGLTMKMKALTAVPIIALLNGIVFVIQKVIGALRSSEETFNRVRVAMAGFQGISDIVTNALQKLGKGIAFVVEGLTKLTSRIKGTSDAQSKRVELTKRQIDLEKREREIIVDNSNLLLESERLRQKATAKDVYNDKQRLTFLQKAVDIEKKVMENNLELAKKRYELIRDTNALTDSSTQDLMDEANAQAEVNNVQKEYESRLKELNSQIVEAKNAIIAKNKATKEGEEIDVEAMKASIDWTQTFKDNNASILEGLAEISAESGGDMSNYVNEVGEQLALAGEYWQNYLDVVEEEAEEEKEIQQEKALAIGSIFGNISALTAELGGENEKAVKASKALALVQVAIESGVAIAKATSSGAKLGIPGIIATVATAVTNLAIAVAKINSAKFATGGVIHGAGTGTSDSVPILASNGEAVMTAKAVDMFHDELSAMNVAGGGVPFGRRRIGNKFATGGVISNSAIIASRSDYAMMQVIDELKNQPVYLDVREAMSVGKRVMVKESR